MREETAIPHHKRLQWRANIGFNQRSKVPKNKIPGSFMALQPRIIACGKCIGAFAMALRFLTGPTVMAVASIAIGLQGTLLHVAIVQAALPQGIIPFVFAKEYNVHPEILSTASRRSKRDSKQVTERPSTRNTDGTQDVAVWHSKRRREIQDPEPVEFPSQETVSKSDHETEKKGSDPKLSNSSKPGHISNAGSYFQHDDRSAVPNSRNVRRRPYSDHGRWNDSTKGQPTDHYKDRVHSADVRGRENRGQVLNKVEGGDRVWSHDRFFELEANEPQEKRKPAFRETKVVSRVVSTAGTAVIVNDDEDGNNEVADNTRREARVDGSEQQHQIEKGSEKDSEVGRKDRDRGYVQRKDLDRGRWLERDGYNDRFQYRGRFSNISRGREKMGRRFDSGVRNQFRSHTSIGEKWKHDLFDETNQSPPPKNEEEQIAKIEMLLSG